MKINDFYRLGLTYYEMAKLLEKEGKNSEKFKEFGYQMKLKSQQAELEGYKNSGIMKFEIRSIDTSCDACKKLNGKIIEIEDAILNNPIPVKECQHKYGCRCVYLAVVE